MSQFEDPPALAGTAGIGMSLRDYFAATALTGFATAFAGDLDGRGSEIAQQAYALADAMLEARAAGSGVR